MIFWAYQKMQQHYVTGLRCTLRPNFVLSASNRCPPFVGTEANNSIEDCSISIEDTSEIFDYKFPICWMRSCDTEIQSKQHYKTSNNTPAVKSHSYASRHFCSAASPAPSLLCHGILRNLSPGRRAENKLTIHCCKLKRGITFSRDLNRMSSLHESSTLLFTFLSLIPSFLSKCFLQSSLLASSSLRLSSMESQPAQWYFAGILTVSMEQRVLILVLFAIHFSRS